MTDFHTHVLPNMDDGSRSVEMSLQMLRLEAQQRVDTVVATSHFYADRETPAAFLRRRAAAAQRLDEAAAEQKLPQRILGAEVHFFSGMGDCDELDELAIEGTRLLLVELPMSVWTERTAVELCKIADMHGLCPVLAHVDRYMLMLRDRHILRRLAGVEYLVQMNTDFFINRRTTRLACDMLRNGEIDFIGSDCHNLGDRAPNIDEARLCIEKRLGRGFSFDLNGV